MSAPAPAARAADVPASASASSPPAPPSASAVGPVPAAASAVSALPAKNVSPEWVGLPALIAKHAAQIALFESQLSAAQYSRIHRAHYDWWLVPIDARQSRHGQAYSVYAAEIAELKANDAFMRQWRRGIEIMTVAWGWNLAEARPLLRAACASGQRWADWPIRLWKMARSAELLGEDAILSSLKTYGRQLIKGKREFAFGGHDLKPMFASISMASPLSHPSSDGSIVPVGAAHSASISSLHRLLALECAFTFLSLADLSRIVRVCVEWRSPVQSMPSLAVTSVYPRLFQSLCASPLARHISRFDEASMKGRQRGSHAQTLAMIAQKMTALQSLTWELQRDALQAPASPLRFPSNLRELDLVFPFKAVAAEGQVAMLAIASLRRLERLALRSVNTEVRLGALVQSASLRHLTVFPHGASGLLDVSNLTNEQIDDLKALTQLHELILPDTAWLPLLTPPHQLRLHSISHQVLVPAMCAALSHLPSLTSLSCKVVQGSSFAFLGCMPSLSKLELDFGGTESALLLTSMLEPDPHLISTITDLSLADALDLDSVCLSRILQRAPHLHRLSVSGGSAVLTSLSFLTDNPALGQSLTHLTLSGCGEIPVSDHVVLHSLAALQSLTLEQTFIGRLSAAQLSSFAHLREFSYEPPYGVEEEEADQRTPDPSNDDAYDDDWYAS